MNARLTLLSLTAFLPIAAAQDRSNSEAEQAQSPLAVETEGRSTRLILETETSITLALPLR